MSISEYAQLLKLPYIRANYQTILLEAQHTNMSHHEFLETVLKHESSLRNQNGIQHRIRNAKFPQRKFLEDFQSEGFSNDIQKKIHELESLDFINRKENVILIGNPGTGKTHLATALGVKACSEGLSVLYVSVPNLVIELKEAMSRHQVAQYKRKFEKYQLVILDELGYVSFDKEGSEILFNLISNRNDIGSIVITSNLTFDRWEEVFKDPILTGALVDRVAFQSHVLDMSGDSYRIKKTMSWLNQKTHR
jgi:DNA replication protein DnaC